MRQAAVLLVTGALAFAPPPVAAQSGGPFSLTWSATGAGGAASIGSGFSLNGLLGSQVANKAIGGNFILQGGWGVAIGSVDAPPSPALPIAFAWLPASPNPFTGKTAFGIALPRAAHVQLDAFDLAGRRVRSFVTADLAPGRHRIEWDGTDQHGVRLASGIYFLHLDAGDLHSSSRIVLVH